jgi:hypothetical protein
MEYAAKWWEDGDHFCEVQMKGGRNQVDIEGRRRLKEADSAAFEQRAQHNTSCLVQIRLTIPIDRRTIENHSIGGGALDAGQGIDGAKPGKRSRTVHPPEVSVHLNTKGGCESPCAIKGAVSSVAGTRPRLFLRVWRWRWSCCRQPVCVGQAERRAEVSFKNKANLSGVEAKDK